jgi:hypothetical protein
VSPVTLALPGAVATTHGVLGQPCQANTTVRYDSEDSTPAYTEATAGAAILLAQSLLPPQQHPLPHPKAC